METIGEYRIDVFKDDTAFVSDSTDNIHKYDFIYLDKSRYDFPTVFGIKVFKEGDLLYSAVVGSVGGGTSPHSNAIIYEEKRILICCADTVFCLSIPELVLLWQTRADVATCFGIYKYKDSYIVHGELEISRLDYDGKTQWQYSGADIFTTIDGKDVFMLKDNFIIVKDFEDRTYQIGYDGKNHTDMTQFS